MKQNKMGQSAEKSSLSKKQERALAALVSQPTMALASAQAGVGTTTLYRWLAEYELFKSEYLRLRREIVNNATHQIQKSMNNAVNATLSLLNDPEVPASVRLSAARTILEFGYKALEMESVEERLAALERVVSERTKSNGHNSRKGVYSY
jgi:hypothetical protein